MNQYISIIYLSISDISYVTQNLICDTKGIFRLLIPYSNIVNGITKNKAKHSEYLLVLKESMG